jgi:hypothetical protein
MYPNFRRPRPFNLPETQVSRTEKKPFCRMHGEERRPTIKATEETAVRGSFVRRYRPVRVGDALGGNRGPAREPPDI